MTICGFCWWHSITISWPRTAELSGSVQHLQCHCEVVLLCIHAKLVLDGVCDSNPTRVFLSDSAHLSTDAKLSVKKSGVYTQPLLCKCQTKWQAPRHTTLFQYDQWRIMDYGLLDWLIDCNSLRCLTAVACLHSVMRFLDNLLWWSKYREKRFITSSRHCSNVICYVNILKYFLLNQKLCITGNMAALWPKHSFHEIT